MYGQKGQTESTDDSLQSIRLRPAVEALQIEIAERASIATFEGIQELSVPREITRDSSDLKHLCSISIEQDEERLQRVLKGKVREELQNYISRGEILANSGEGKVSVPIHSIDIPHFTYASDDQQDGAEGQGKGKGKSKGKSANKGKDPGSAEAGEDSAEHALEVEVSIEELTELLGEELELPRIEPKGREAIKAEEYDYNTIAKEGPRSLAHFRRTFKQALKREIAADTYDPEDPQIVPRKEDFRYRAARPNEEFQSSAVVFHMMDVSGSMGKDQKEMARAISFWTDLWIEKHYDQTAHVFISHDAEAREVEREVFFTQREAGGTKISSAYELALKLIEERYSPADWNIYLFQYSDGDNWSGQDTERCFKILKEKLLPMVNLLAYAQVKSDSGSGQYIREVRQNFNEEQKIISSEINSKQEVSRVIKEFLSSGK